MTPVVPKTLVQWDQEEYWQVPCHHAGPLPACIVACAASMAAQRPIKGGVSWSASCSARTRATLKAQSAHCDGPTLSRHCGTPSSRPSTMCGAPYRKAPHMGAHNGARAGVYTWSDAFMLPGITVCNCVILLFISIKECTNTPLYPRFPNVAPNNSCLAEHNKVPVNGLHESMLPDLQLCVKVQFKC